MHKTLVVISFICFSAFPAFAKSHDVYPVSCDVLWSAVKIVLQNPKDYGVMGMSDSGRSATFIVVGEATAYQDSVALTDRDTGCAMKLSISQVGSDNSDERGFRNRLDKSLARLQAAKAAKPAPTQ